MENIHTTDSYIAVLEHRLAALTAERDRFRAEAICLSEELQGLHTLSERLSSERDNLAGVVEKMQRELRELRRMLFGCKSERFIPSDPSQLKLDFEGVAQLQQEREYAAQQESASISRNKPASRTAKSTEDRQRRIFSEHLERRDEFIEPNEIPAGSKRIGEEITELLEYKPGELYIRRLIRPKYALLGGEGGHHRAASVASASQEQCRAVAAGAAARRQISGSSAVAPSDSNLRPRKRAPESLHGV